MGGTGGFGPLQVRRDGAPVTIPGAKPRAILTMLGLHGGSVVSADTLVELLWGEDPPRTAAKALQTHISSLRRSERVTRFESFDEDQRDLALARFEELSG